MNDEFTNRMQQCALLVLENLRDEFDRISLGSGEIYGEIAERMMVLPLTSQDIQARSVELRSLADACMPVIDEFGGEATTKITLAVMNQIYGQLILVLGLHLEDAKCSR